MSKIAGKGSRTTKKTLDKVLYFVGVSVSGGKSDKTWISCLEFYPDQNKIFLSKLDGDLGSQEHSSGDSKIYEYIKNLGPNLNSVGFDAPLSLPKCMRCQLKCPGYEVCLEPEIEWMRTAYLADKKKTRPKKFFTPYTQRPADMYWAQRFSQLEVQEALGSNLAPLTARSLFLSRRLQSPLLEVSTRIAVWLLGQKLKIAKTQLRIFRNSIGGEEARSLFLKTLLEKEDIFLYVQDHKNIIRNLSAFESFITAYLVFLNHQGACESQPKDFPPGETWPLVPRL